MEYLLMHVEIIQTQNCGKTYLKESIIKLPELSRWLHMTLQYLSHCHIRGVCQRIQFIVYEVEPRSIGKVEYNTVPDLI